MNDIDLNIIDTWEEKLSVTEILGRYYKTVETWRQYMLENPVQIQLSPPIGGFYIFNELYPKKEFKNFKFGR